MAGFGCNGRLVTGLIEGIRLLVERDWPLHVEPALAHVRGAGLPLDHETSVIVVHRHPAPKRSRAKRSVRGGPSGSLGRQAPAG